MKSEKKNRPSGCKIALLSIYENCNSAVRYLSAVLRDEGFDVCEIYFKHWTNNHLSWPTLKEMNLLVDVLKKESPNIVAVSLRCSAYYAVTSYLTEKIRSVVNAKILWGGLHPTLVPDQCIDVADMVCIGEGEGAILDLARGLRNGAPPRDIPNLWIREGDEIKKNKLRPLIEDLDTIPFRDYSGDRKYYIIRNRIHYGDPMLSSPTFDIMTSRGCPFACSYCYNATLKAISGGNGNYYRYRSADNVIGEIEEATKTFEQIRYVRFDDNIFTFNKRWVKEFAQKYSEKIKMPFDCLLHPNVASEEFLTLLKRAGLRAVTTGIQNSQNVSNTIYNRKVLDKKIIKFAKLCKKLDIEVHFQIILDDIRTREEDNKQLFNLLLSLPRPLDIYLFSLTHYPKTNSTEDLLRKGLISKNEVEGIDTKTFRQYRVSLNYPRTKEDQFWTILIVLISKSFLPKSFLNRLSKSKFFRDHPLMLKIFAQICNLVKMVFMAIRIVVRGEMSTSFLIQWLNFRSIITS